MLMRSGDEIDIPRIKDLFEDLVPDNFIYLFAIDDDKFYLAKEGVEPSFVAECYTYESTRALRINKPGYLCMAGMTANHLHAWYRDNKYCGRCGAKTSADTELRMLKCPDCGNMIFPRINPAVIIGVRDGDKLLVSQYAGRPQSSMYALLAGFCEIGESAEGTVIRETLEEVGLKVKNVQYFGSQPWGFAGNISIGYFCDVDGSIEITLDENELSQALFLPREELPDDLTGVSLTAAMIQAFKDGKW